MYINFWYPIARSEDVKNDAPFRAQVLGVRFVTFRDDKGAAHVLHDVCTHRGGSLGKGWVRDTAVVCPYHGWRFGGDGKCSSIPSLSDENPPARAKVDSYPVQEKYGIVFASLGDLPENERPPLNEIEEFDKPGWRANKLTDELSQYIGPGRTVALLGSSGVGKSTLINRVLGLDRQRTREVRAKDGRGRHTTSQRELIVLPAGGLLVDTPGMRELQLWEATTALDETFADICALAKGCHFRDCRHETEPRCAVREAVGRGQLAPERQDSYVRLLKELDALNERRDALAMTERKRADKIISRAVRRFYKDRG